ncbi:MAG: beta-ketoacyl synthase chain length factor [Candidatus Competibacteraceae bacterium]|nr:beta-ketoacyl synthase chain length factor [Candidatus Competibacteraceae bacterium]
MKPLAVESIGLLAPGLSGWAASREVLIGARAHAAEPLPVAIATLLPANERRRTTVTIKLALQVAQEAMAEAAGDARTVSAVFASSGGDSEILDKICTALTQPDRPVSPTHFHQSVHNTPAGYWSIATSCRQPSLSLSAYDHSFATGLSEAAALAWAEAAQVLLVAYDLPLPFPLAERRHIVAPFAVALLLNPVSTERRQALIRLRRLPAGPVDRLDDPGLERLRADNPAARGLPLLCAIARRAAGLVMLPAGEDAALQVEVER